MTQWAEEDEDKASSEGRYISRNMWRGAIVGIGAS
jgi:hypothetical protein